MVVGVGFHPLPVHFGPLTQDRFIDDRDTHDIAEKVDHLFGPRQTTQIPVDDDAVEAMVYKYKQAAKQLCERLHRLSSWIKSRQQDHRSDGRWSQNFKYVWLGLGR